MNPFSIIRARPSDLEPLIYLSRKIFYDSFHQQNKPENMKEYMDRAFNPAQLITELENRRSEFYFIIDQDRKVGYIKINQSGAQSDLQDDDSIEVERIYVDAAYQGKGLGTLLINHAKERAEEMNLKYIWLGVWERNKDAIRFYERHGFEAISFHEFRMGDDIQTDILMKCKV
jgi:ribosomal protein S18 acetylase RimI-like enzyme